MLHFPTWKIAVVVVVVCALGVLFALPNLLPKDSLDGLPELVAP